MQSQSLALWVPGILIPSQQAGWILLLANDAQEAAWVEISDISAGHQSLPTQLSAVAENPSNEGASGSGSKAEEDLNAPGTPEKKEGSPGSQKTAEHSPCRKSAEASERKDLSDEQAVPKEGGSSPLRSNAADGKEQGEPEVDSAGNKVTKIDVDKAGEKGSEASGEAGFAKRVGSAAGALSSGVKSFTHSLAGAVRFAENPEVRLHSKYIRLRRPATCLMLSLKALQTLAYPKKVLGS